jgi:hypothetical protein
LLSAGIAVGRFAMREGEGDDQGEVDPSQPDSHRVVHNRGRYYSAGDPMKTIPGLGRRSFQFAHDHITHPGD